MNPASDEFLSPQILLDLVKSVLGGGIDFDPYSSVGQLVKCRDGLTITSDPEPLPKSGNFYANIPFSKSEHAMERLATHFAANPAINALVVCLAAPSSLYWANTIWSPEIGCRRVGWLPRLSFLRLNEHGVAVPTEHGISRDIALSLWTSEERLVSRFEKFVPLFDPPTKRPRKKPRPPVRISLGGRK